MNRTESCYTHASRMCQFRANVTNGHVTGKVTRDGVSVTQGVPIAKPVRITLEDGTKQTISRREGKALRAHVKAERKRVFKFQSAHAATTITK